MSNYNAPDKSAGSSWTWQEHNELKEAVNSKIDADKLVQDFAAPTSSTFPSTAAVVDFLSSSAIMIRGVLNGSESIRTATEFNKSGIWISDDTFDTNTTNAQYPAHAPGMLRRVQNSNLVILEYITAESNPRYFICSKLGAYPFSDWRQIATDNYLTVNNYCQCSNVTPSPPVVSVTDVGGINVYDITLVDGSWNRGTVKVVSDNTLDPEDVVNIDLAFGVPLDGRIVTASPYGAKVCDIEVTKGDQEVTVTLRNFSDEEELTTNQVLFNLLIQ